MNTFLQATGLGVITLAGVVGAMIAPAQAAWDYGVDSFNDGISGTLGGQYEFYGIGINQVGNQVYVGLDSRFPIGGDPGSGIAWGDLIFNFSGTSLAAANGNLLAVRFAGNNDAGVSGTGVFGNVTAQFVDNGFDSLADHSSDVSSQGGSPSMGDLSDTDPYFNGSYNVIGSGTKLGEIEMLDAAALAGLGFSLPNTGGPESVAFDGSTRGQFGFKFQLPDAAVGQFVAHVFAECLNDGVAIAGEFKTPAPTPEPTMMLGLAGLGLALGARRRRLA